MLTSSYMFDLYSISTSGRGRTTEVNLTRNMKRTDVKKWMRLDLALLECSVIGAFRVKLVQQSVRNHEILFE